MFVGSDAFFVNENNTLELRHNLDRENISSYDITVAVANIIDCDQGSIPVEKEAKTAIFFFLRCWRVL